MAHLVVEAVYRRFQRSSNPARYTVASANPGTVLANAIGGPGGLRGGSGRI